MPFPKYIFAAYFSKGKQIIEVSELESIIYPTTFM